jgi:molecular chaperone HscC
MSKRPIIGIDLGTTYSLVSVLQGKTPIILPNALGEALTPSAVGIDDDGQFLVGAAARARAANHPTKTVLSFKRDMGTSVQYTLGGEVFTPVDLSAMVIRALKQDAEQILGETVEEAVITVPAYFGDAQRHATRVAGRVAGLRIERIINEPTAAAMAYGLHHLDRELQAVVVDLGGGTFDVTVMEIVEGVIEIQSSAGDARLGGDDFRDALAKEITRLVTVKVGTDSEGSRGQARIREAAEDAKRRLSSKEEVEVVLPRFEDGHGEMHDVGLSLSRVRAEELFAPLLERMKGPVRRALRDANLTADDIDEVILVGGATRMPCVARLAGELFGKMPNASLPPDEAVALGAAVQAALKADDEAVDDLVVTDVAPFTLGISSGTRVGNGLVQGFFSPIIERGTVIPASRVKRFSTLSDRQTQIVIEVFQGEHSLCKQNTKLGEYVARGLPRLSAGEAGIDVRFTYDLNGILEVEMQILGKKNPEYLIIENQPGRLSEENVLAAREAMKRIKFHPRESLPNRTALARADALFVELTGISRDELGLEIQRFHAALETQDPALINPLRERLNALVGQLG